METRRIQRWSGYCYLAQPPARPKGLVARFRAWLLERPHDPDFQRCRECWQHWLLSTPISRWDEWQWCGEVPPDTEEPV